MAVTSDQVLATSDMVVFIFICLPVDEEIFVVE